VDCLSSTVAAPATEGIVYGQDEVQQAWGAKHKNADAILMWPDQAVVVEISSRAPTLDTLRANSGPGLGLT
jgi:hypothetical protein